MNETLEADDFLVHLTFKPTTFERTSTNRLGQAVVLVVQLCRREQEKNMSQHVSPLDPRQATWNHRL